MELHGNRMIADTASQVNKYFCCWLLARRPAVSKSDLKTLRRKRAVAPRNRLHPNDCERTADYFAIEFLADCQSMQTILLSCLFGAVCTMVLCAAGAADVMRDRMMRRGGELSPPEET
jgi:hypothetical protein